MSKIKTVRHLAFGTISDALFDAPEDKNFVTFWKNEGEVESVTFGEFRKQALAQAGYLLSQGIERQNTIILIMPQGISLMTAFVGAMLVGAIPAILAYPNFKIEPSKFRLGLEGVTANLKASLVLVDKDFPDDLIQHITVQGAGRLQRWNGDYHLGTCPEVRYLANPNDLAFIQHSAGTTGLQKGVALSHSAVLKQIGHLAMALDLSSEDRIYSWLPIYHDMGLVACFMVPLVCHLPVVMQSPADWVMQPATMLELISSYQCSLAWAPNFTLQFLARRVRREDRVGLDLSCLRALINCSEPVRAASMDEFISAYPSVQLRANVLQTCYAMAETVFAVTQSDVTSTGPRRIWIDGDAFRKLGRAIAVREGSPGAVCFVSSGRCLPNTKVRIVSDEGKVLGPGEVGEITIHSDCILEGYYNRPDLTAKALRNGSYWSGDLGFLLDDELYVIGRKKDLIIVGGENIYPQDIEEIASSHPAVHDGRVVAFGRYNPTLGTEEIIVVAEVSMEDDLQKARTIDRQIRTAVSSELGVGIGSVYLKPPKWIVKSSAGKPARSTTREKLLSEHAELREQGEASQYLEILSL